MAESKPTYPERIDLNFQNCKAVKSRKTQEDLVVIEAEDYKTGALYSVWLRKDAVSKLLIEVGKMLE